MSIKPTDVIEYMGVEGADVYVIGSSDTRVTIHAQQIKSLNLVWALYESGRLHKDSRVCIIGGGVAGLTAAAGLISKGIHPKLIERHSRLLGVQAGSHTRYVHPNIYFWPDKKAEAPTTMLPFMNWRPETADNVSRTLAGEWTKFSSKCEVLTRANCVRVLRSYQDGIGVTFTDRDSARESTEAFDVVIIAVGFGIERSIPGIASVPYWRDDDLHQLSESPARRRIAVIGAGDGGLTDVLRLSIERFDHGSFLKSFSERSDSIAVGEYLAKADINAANRRNRLESINMLRAAFDNCYIPDNLRDLVINSVSSENDVTLFDHSGSPYLPNAAVLNRLVLKILIDNNKVLFVPRAFDANIDTGFSRIIPRIGPEGVLNSILSEWSYIIPDDEHVSQQLALVHCWSSTFFLRLGTARLQYTVLVLRTNNNRHNSDLISSVGSMVGIHNEDINKRIIVFTEVSLSAEEIDTISDYLPRVESRHFDLLLIVDSEIALQVRFVSDMADNIVICCESQICKRVANAFRPRFPAVSLYTVAQDINFDYLIGMLEEAFNSHDMCFLRGSNDFADMVYFNLLFSGFSTSLLTTGEGVRLTDYIIDDDFDTSNIPPAFVYTGRYFVHRFATSQFFCKFPYLSGYGSDLSLGALAVYDIDPTDCANYIADRIVTKLASGLLPSSLDWIVNKAYLKINLSAARLFNIELPERFILMADEVLG